MRLVKAIPLKLSKSSNFKFKDLKFRITESCITKIITAEDQIAIPAAMNLSENTKINPFGNKQCSGDFSPAC